MNPPFPLRRRPLGSRTIASQDRAADNIPVNTTVIHVPRGLHCPLPMRMLTSFTASGYFSLASGTAAYILPFKLGSPRLPFAGAAPTGVTWNNLTPASFQPPGFAILISSNIYAQGIVLSATVELDVSPQTVQDSIVVTGTPSNVNNAPASVGAAMTRPWTKQQNFASGRVNRTGDFPWRHHIPISKFFGLPPLLYNNDVSGTWNFSPSTDPIIGMFYVINFETGDAANLVDSMECRIRITYRVLLRDLATETLL
jgi:hypothetical protein